MLPRPVQAAGHRPCSLRRDAQAQHPYPRLIIAAQAAWPVRQHSSRCSSSSSCSPPALLRRHAVPRSCHTLTRASFAPWFLSHGVRSPPDACRLRRGPAAAEPACCCNLGPPGARVLAAGRRRPTAAAQPPVTQPEAANTTVETCSVRHIEKDEIFRVVTSIL